MSQEQDRVVIADLVDAVLAEVQRRSPPTEYVTREWLEKGEAVIPEAIDSVLQGVKGLPPRASEALRTLLGEMVSESWKEAAGQCRPEPWVERFYGAKTKEERDRIFYSALKYTCLEKKRQQAQARKRFVSLDELEERASAGDGEPPPSALPSTQDNQDAGLLKEQLHEALLELPIMVAVTAHLLPMAEGNVSKLARHLDLPQRQVARYVARIRKHFAEKGLGPV